MNVEGIVSERFANIVKVEKGTLDLGADLRETYGLDSVKALKLISDVEVEFDIDIEQEEARELKTLNDVIGLIKTKLD